jgi:hypothetical protein
MKENTTREKRQKKENLNFGSLGREEKKVVA